MGLPLPLVRVEGLFRGPDIHANDEDMVHAVEVLHRDGRLRAAVERSDEFQGQDTSGGVELHHDPPHPGVVLPFCLDVKLPPDRSSGEVHANEGGPRWRYGLGCGEAASMRRPDHVPGQAWRRVHRGAIQRKAHEDVVDVRPLPQRIPERNPQNVEQSSRFCPPPRLW